MIVIIALIWLVPLMACEVMAMGSWISPRFRRLCTYHLFGGENPTQAIGSRSKGGRATSTAIQDQQAVP
jgi:hypothetical protein